MFKNLMAGRALSYRLPPISFIEMKQDLSVTDTINRFIIRIDEVAPTQAEDYCKGRTKFVRYGFYFFKAVIIALDTRIADCAASVE